MQKRIFTEHQVGIHPENVESYTQIKDLQNIPIFGCFSSKQCPNCKIKLVCDSGIPTKVGQTIGDTHYVQGPCCCALFKCDVCGHDWSIKYNLIPNEYNWWSHSMMEVTLKTEDEEMPDRKTWDLDDVVVRPQSVLDIEEPACFTPRPKIPERLIRRGFWEVFDSLPKDELSLHIVRLVALQIDKLTDEDKKGIIDIFTGRLAIYAIPQEYCRKVGSEKIKERDEDA